MKCLVLGGNGFLGSAVAQALASDGHEVTVFDRFSGGHVYLDQNGIQLIRGDFADRDQVRRAVIGQQLVFHMVSATTPATQSAKPFDDIDQLVSSAIGLMEACRDEGVDRLYFASSGGAIYGDQQLDRYTEVSATFPVSPYGIGKLTIESWLSYFRTNHGLNSVSLRIANPFGPSKRTHAYGLIPLALRHALAGEPIVRLGDGTMTRDYVFLPDLVRMVLRLSRQAPQHTIYNLGSGTGRSVNQVLAQVESCVGVPLKIIEKPAPRTFVQSVVLDTSRFSREFGAVAQTDFATALCRTLDDSRTSPPSD